MQCTLVYCVWCYEPINRKRRNKKNIFFDKIPIIVAFTKEINVWWNCILYKYYFNKKQRLNEKKLKLCFVWNPSFASFLMGLTGITFSNVYFYTFVKFVPYQIGLFSQISYSQHIGIAHARPKRLTDTFML